MSSLARRVDRRVAHRAPSWARSLDALPPRQRVTFLADGGAGLGLSVWAASLLLHRDRPDVHQVWACQRGVLAPPWSTRVAVGSGRHRWLAARSQVWLTDGWPMRVDDPEASGIPLARGPRTVVRTIIDPSLEKVGTAVVDWPLLPRSARRLPQGGDQVIAPSEPGIAAARAWGIEAPALVVPYLAEAVADRDSARTRLGIGPQERMVAWHLSASRGHAPFPAAEVAAGLPGVRVVAVDGSPDPVSVVAAADVVVADTGWPLPAAAAAARAVVVHAPDPRDGRSRGPGLVVDWPSGLPTAATAADVVSMVAERLTGPLATDREALARLGAVAADGDPRGRAARTWDEVLGVMR